jgi:hypothetical protein
LPTGNPDEVWQHRIGKKIEPVRLLYAAGDHVLVARDRSLSWVPALSVGGHTPATPPAVSALPETTGGVERTYGNLTINLDNWKITNWTDAAGKVSHGHRLLSVDATIGIDTSTITMTLLQAVEQARQNLTIAEATLAEKQALFDAASASPDAAAKKQAQSNLKAAQKGIKDGQKALSSTEKSLTGGVQKFLLEQTKAIDCGSFTLDTGRKTLKPKKGSLTRKSCNPLKAGQPVSAQLHFELERWDVPFVISWKGPGNSLQFARVASKKLASIPSR